MGRSLTVERQVAAPMELSTGHLRGALAYGPGSVGTFGFGSGMLLRDAENAFVFVREDFDEFRAHLFPVFDHPLTAGALGVLDVPCDQRQELHLVLVGDGLEVD